LLPRRAAAEEDKKRKDLHEDSNEALVESEEEVDEAHRARQKRCPSATCPLRLRNQTRRATPPREKQVIDIAQWAMARRTAHFLTRNSATTNQILLSQELAANCLRLKNLKVTTTPRGGATPPPRRTQPLLLLSRSNPPTEGGHKNLKVEIPTTKTAIHPWITETLNKGYGKFPPPSKKAAE